jgi:hypothetical protein
MMIISRALPLMGAGDLCDPQPVMPPIEEVDDELLADFLSLLIYELFAVFRLK